MGRRCAGVSLVELLIGLLLSLLVLAGLFQLQRAVGAVYHEQRIVSERAEVLAFVVTLLTDEVRRAGYVDNAELQIETPVTGGSDWFRLRYAAARNCLGHLADSGVASNLWEVDAGSLYCTAGGQRQPLIDGLQGMQVSYLPVGGGQFIPAAQLALLSPQPQIGALRIELTVDGLHHPFTFTAAVRSQ